MRDLDVTIASHGFDGHTLFFGPVCAIYAKMNLFVDRRLFRENRWPIDAPTDKQCERIARYHK
jgi:hypothetical protein